VIIERSLTNKWRIGKERKCGWSEDGQNGTAAETEMLRNGDETTTRTEHDHEEGCRDWNKRDKTRDDSDKKPACRWWDMTCNEATIWEKESGESDRCKNCEDRVNNKITKSRIIHKQKKARNREGEKGMEDNAHSHITQINTSEASFIVRICVSTILRSCRVLSCWSSTTWQYRQPTDRWDSDPSITNTPITIL